MYIKRFKPAYLLFLAIPLLYYFLREKDNTPVSSNKQDYFYFSVRTSQPAVISLFATGDSLVSWEVNSAGYKYLDYVGRLNDSSGIVLKVRNLSANDTISFSAFNLYRGNTVLSINKPAESQCTVKNATVYKTGYALTTLVKDSGKPVDICLQKSTSWEKPDVDHWFNLLIKITFLVTFIIILLFAPPVRYFITTCALVLLMMGLFFWIGSDFHCKVTLYSKSQVKSFQTFYNNDPCFVANKMSASGNAGNSFSTAVDLNNDNCIRCDADGCAELNDVHYKIHAGFLSYDWNLASLSHSGMMMNDLLLKNNKFCVTGNDPHFVFTSNYFTDHIRWLLFVRKNLFLFISLLIFIILAALHTLITRNNLNLLHPAYLFFLLIPVTYYLIMPVSISVKSKENKYLLYFSIKTTRPSLVELDDAGKCIDSLEVNSPGYKYLQYSGDSIDDDASLSIKVRNLATYDTVSILSVNIFHNGHVISLDHDKGSLNRITNAVIIKGNGTVDAVVQTSGTPVSITLPLLYAWQKSTPERDVQIYIVLLFIAVFLLVLLFAPQVKYFIATCALTLVILITSFLLCKNAHYQVAMQTGCPVKGVDFFYNDNPCFDANKKVSVYDWTCFFKTNLDLTENNYLRCDLDDSTSEFRDFHVMLKKGYLQNDMNFCNISPDKMLFNDLNYRNGNYIITGNDPYFCLTSSYFVKHLQRLLLLRNNMFLFISIFVFLLFLSLRPRAKRRGSNLHSA